MAAEHGRVCAHTGCSHIQSVPGDCGERRCPLNAARTQQALHTGVASTHDRTLAVVEADPFPRHHDNGGPIVVNAFSVTDEVDPDLVIGREHERRLIERLLSSAAEKEPGQKRVVVLAGPSGSGKTALLRRVKRDLTNEKRAHRVAFTDVKTVQTDDAYTDRIKHRLAVDHGGWWSRLTYAHTKDSRLSLGTPDFFAGYPVPFKAKLQTRVQNRIERLKRRDLPSLISHCSEQARKRGRTLVLSLDAGSELTPDVLSQIASGADLAQTNNAPCLIVATTNRNATGDVADIGKSRYEQLLNVLQVRDLPRDDIQQLLREGARRSNATWDPDALKEARRLSRNNVRYAHLVGHYAIENVAARDGGTITPKEVTFASHRAFEDMAPTYRAALRRVGVDSISRHNNTTLPDDAATLIAVDQLQSDGKDPNARNVSAAANVAPRDTLVSLNRLRDVGLLDTNGSTYASRVPYIADFWSSHILQPETVESVS